MKDKRTINDLLLEYRMDEDSLFESSLQDIVGKLRGLGIQYPGNFSSMSFDDHMDMINKIAEKIKSNNLKAADAKEFYKSLKDLFKTDANDLRAYKFQVMAIHMENAFKKAKGTRINANLIKKLVGRKEPV